MRLKKLILFILFFSTDFVHAADLYSPSNASTSIPLLGQHFSWSYESNSTISRIVISDKSDFSNFIDNKGESYCIKDTNCFTQSFSNPQEKTYISITLNNYMFSPNTLYFWKVRKLKFHRLMIIMYYRQALMAAQSYGIC